RPLVGDRLAGGAGVHGRGDRDRHSAAAGGDGTVPGHRIRGDRGHRGAGAGGGAHQGEAGGQDVGEFIARVVVLDPASGVGEDLRVGDVLARDGRAGLGLGGGDEGGRGDVERRRVIGCSGAGVIRLAGRFVAAVAVRVVGDRPLVGDGRPAGRNLDGGGDGDGDRAAGRGQGAVPGHGVGRDRGSGRAGGGGGAHQGEAGGQDVGEFVARVVRLRGAAAVGKGHGIGDGAAWR